MTGKAAHLVTTLRELAALTIDCESSAPRSIAHVIMAVGNLTEWELRNLIHGLSVIEDVINNTELCLP